MKDAPKILCMTAKDEEGEQYKYDSENSQDSNCDSHVSGPHTSQVQNNWTNHWETENPQQQNRGN